MNASSNECLQKIAVAEINSGEQSLWHYCLIAETYNNIDLGEYHTYGIQVSGLDFSEVMHDISPCKDTVAWMIESFNQHQLLPVHLRDAVEDMLP